ncbi:MAG: hypothetical protein INF92_07910 [Rhodobacter sp.]|nr:hypothetical protein [Rhodobacter sp.]
MPGTICAAGREAEPCLVAGLAEKRGLTGGLAGAAEESSAWAVARKDRGQVLRPEG